MDLRPCNNGLAPDTTGITQLPIFIVCVDIGLDPGLDPGLTLGLLMALVPKLRLFLMVLPSLEVPGVALLLVVGVAAVAEV